MPPPSPLDQIDAWPVDHAAAAVLRPGGEPLTHGDTGRVYELASVTKMLTAWAVLVATEEGLVELDEAIGQPGCTLRHLLAHAGGYPFDGPAPIAKPGVRRIYSNTGIELAAGLVAERAAMPFAEYLAEAVFQPLAMTASEVTGSPAWSCRSTVADLTRFAAEVLTPRLIQPATATVAWTVQFPGLPGMVPGVGRYRDCPWGCGFEIKGNKSPHWMGRTNTPAAFGHFGGAGTFLWMERGPGGDHGGAGCALIVLTDRRFDRWADQALQLWPRVSDAVLASIGPMA